MFSRFTKLSNGTFFFSQCLDWNKNKNINFLPHCSVSCEISSARISRTYLVLEGDALLPKYSSQLAPELAKDFFFCTVDLDLPCCSFSIENDWTISHGRSSVCLDSGCHPRLQILVQYSFLYSLSSKLLDAKDIYLAPVTIMS